MPRPGSGEVPPGTPSDIPPGTPSDTPSDEPLGMPSDEPLTEPSDQPLAEPADEPTGEPFDGRVADFYSPGVPLNRVRPRPRGTTIPADLLLRILEPPAVKVRHIPLVDLLRKPYRELGGD
ncbi:hypothetical protein ACLQ2R_32315 [Streptosporangium sp. DT93]|uniref:hypothetical protein n=1 Tax=Streptosporangium sp. DT93 TaxID=3393428 RepID=UPI003CEF0D44